jgi:hypothetical protein
LSRLIQETGEEVFFFGKYEDSNTENIFKTVEEIIFVLIRKMFNISTFTIISKFGITLEIVI